MSMQKNFGGNSNTVKFLHVHLVSTSFLMFCSPFWCSSQSQGQEFHSGVSGVNSEFSASEVLCQEEYYVHIDVFLFCCLRFIQGHFCMSANMLLHLAFISLICTSTLQPFFCDGFTYVTYYLFVCFLILKNSLVQLQVCISLAVESPLLSLCPISYPPKLVPLHTAPCVSLILPGMYSSILVKPWWYHTKIDKQK